MGIADDMKRLSEDITTSYDLRVKEIGTLVSDVHDRIFPDVHKKLKDFAVDRKKISAEQKKALSDFVAELNKNVETMIKEFHGAHADMSVELRKDLSNYVADIKVYVENKLEEFDNAHAEMSEELRKDSEELRKELAKGETDRLNSFKSMMEENRKRIGEIHERVKEIETYVENKLKEFHDDHADMSEELKKNLADYVEGIVSETRNLLTGFEDERKRMEANWQDLTAKMADKRGVEPKVEAEVKVRPVREAVKEKVPPGDGLENKILKFIKKHPKGAKVSDMEVSIGIPRMRLGQVAKRLFDDGKVRKEENLYFPL